MNFIRKITASGSLPLCYLLLAALTVGATVLRSIALTLSFDADIGYFQKGLIPVYILLALAAALCAAIPFLIKKEALDKTGRTSRTAELIAAALPALVLLVLAFYLLARRKSIPAPALLVVLAAFLCATGAAYFGSRLRDGQDTATGLLFGYGAILGMTLLLAITYFDLYTQMNAPHKLSQHLALLVAMVALLYELRILTKTQFPRIRAASAGLASFSCTVVGISNTVGFLAGSLSDVTYLLIDLLLVTLGVYFAVTCTLLCLPAKTDKEDAHT